MLALTASVFLAAMATSRHGTAVGRDTINKFNLTIKNINMQTQYLINSILYAVVGIVILVAVFVIVEKATPKHNLWKEIVENKNTALAIVAGCFMLAMAIIIASAIH
jgi:uncharacterized membrane protein YjfL (UPF0719 family)